MGKVIQFPKNDQMQHSQAVAVNKNQTTGFICNLCQGCGFVAMVGGWWHPRPLKSEPRQICKQCSGRGVSGEGF
ncbi:MAG: hypothetical protein OXR68_00185 [Alphaproteobacteria bacterium]|nr:hypothetical protein [Alphaproteobacteria bacterium]MDD9919029.1 hypothetical protein [Alphaproteobacteria bacterium]